jgi:hypothetical protein
VAKADLKDTAFEVGDEVICVDRPFELLEIIKQHPGSGERQYRIGPLPIRSKDGKTIKKASEESKQRDVGENELMRLEKVLDELLEDAKAKKDGATRNELLVALCLARMSYNGRTKKDLPSADAVRGLQTSIQKTRDLLAQSGILDTVFCKIGDGVVDVSPLPLKIPVLVPSQTQVLKIFHSDSPVEGTAIVSIPNLLELWHRSIEEQPTKKRGGQKKEYRRAICEEAIRFFSLHSASGPSTDPTNAVHGFVERFYERVTGSPLGRGLEYQIRQVLEAQACAVRSQKNL